PAHQLVFLWDADFRVEFRNGFIPSAAKLAVLHSNSQIAENLARLLERIFTVERGNTKGERVRLDAKPSFSPTQRRQRKQNKSRCVKRRNVHAQPDAHSDRRFRPNSRRGRQSHHVAAVPQNHARADESDPSDDLRRNARMVIFRVSGRRQRNHHEEARSHADQHARAQTSRFAMKLAFEADDAAERGGQRQSPGNRVSEVHNHDERSSRGAFYYIGSASSHADAMWNVTAS